MFRRVRGGQATRLPSVKNVIAVAAGKGGVGKSINGCNQLGGVAAAAKVRVGMLDADVYGPSLPTMLGEPERSPQINPRGQQDWPGDSLRNEA